MNQHAKKSIQMKEIPLDQRISFRLQRTGTLLTTQAVSILKALGGVTLNQWRLLSFLNERNGGSVHELTRMGFIDKATLSRAATVLLKRELIVAETSASDRRSTLLRVTPKGREIIEAVAPAMIKRQDELMTALADEEREALFKILDKLDATISKSEIGVS